MCTWDGDGEEGWAGKWKCKSLQDGKEEESQVLHLGENREKPLDMNIDKFFLK